MFFNTNRREFFKLCSLGALGTLTKGWANTQPAARLSVGKTSSGVRIIANVNPIDSLWEVQRSIDEGKTWVKIGDEGTLIGSGRIRWDIPTEPNAPVGIFRLNLSPVLKVGNETHRLIADQNLFAAMTELQRSNPSFSFNSEYRTNPEGQFVTEVNGIKGKWVFEVNGQRINDSVDVGSSLYVPKLGDQIEWRILA